jgi:hypothetical protein
MLISKINQSKNVNNDVITQKVDTLWHSRHTFFISLTHEEDETYKKGKACSKGSKSSV